ncbi:MAG TPA: hypothetical protein VMB25_08650 [Bryobacteraceae bacterium]|nr:hypothetical protein [Bryobacteraceae bacterium]
MIIKIVSSRQLPAPRIVYDYVRPKFGGLEHGLNFAAVPHALSCALGEKKFDRALFVPVTASNERIRIEEQP